MLTPPVEPMLAVPVDRLPRATACRGGCVYEPKFDGYRALVFVGETVTIQSRRGADITDSFRDVADSASDQLLTGTVLDGELAVLGAGGGPPRGRAGKWRHLTRFVRPRPDLTAEELPTATA